MIKGLPAAIVPLPGAKALMVRQKANTNCQVTVLFNGRIATDLRHQPPGGPEPVTAEKTFDIYSGFDEFKIRDAQGKALPANLIQITVLCTQFRGRDQGIEVSGSFQIDDQPEIPFEYSETPVDPGMTNTFYSVLVIP